METKSETIEQLKQKLEKKYTSVLETRISVSNFSGFYEEAINNLIEIVNESIVEYKKINIDSPLSGKNLEDASLKYFNLISVNETLDIISERVEEISNLEHRIKETEKESQRVFVEPNEDEKLNFGNGGSGIEKKELLPRLQTLIYILENDLKLSLDEEDEIEIYKGQVRKGMMRKEPYYRIYVRKLNRLIYVCNEEGNATFIFNAKETLEIKGLETLDIINKDERRELIKENPALGKVLIQTEYWRINILDALTNDFIFNEKSKPFKFLKPGSDFEKINKIDLNDKIEFNKFRDIVRSFGIKSSLEYKNNRKKEKWPASETLKKSIHFPRLSDGGNDWKKFLGIEGYLDLDLDKKEDFEKFRDIVRSFEIKSSLEYKNNQKKEKWPTSETLKKSIHFPRLSDGGNDWKKFLGKEK